MKNYFRIIYINIFIFLILLFFLEITARIGIFVLRGYSTVGLNERTLNLNYQPYVMFGHNWEREFKKLEIKNKYRIMILGGSTGEGWSPNILEDTLKKNFDIDTEVINAAHGAYNVRQQLIVLSIWGKRIDPDLVITLDGTNDLLHGVRGETAAGTFYLNDTYNKYLTKPYMGSIFYLIQNSQLYNGLMRLQRRFVDLKMEDSLDYVEIYLETKKNLSIISNSFGAHHISILQPYLGFKKIKTIEEKNSIKPFMFRDKVVKELFEYTEKELDVLYKNDLNTTHLNSQNLFNKEKRIFSGPYHFNDNYGYEILSKKIGEILIQRKLIQN
jgi:hypothetical protein